MLTGRPSRSSSAAISRELGGAPTAAAFTPPLADPAPEDPTRGGSALCQDVTLASR